MELSFRDVLFAKMHTYVYCWSFCELEPSTIFPTSFIDLILSGREKAKVKFVFSARSNKRIIALDL